MQEPKPLNPKSKTRTQEEDREGLVRQLVAIKKENARLQREIEKLSDGTHLEGISRPVRFRV